MGNLARDEIRTFLQKLGERYSHLATLYSLGGSALCFLGNPRRTVDIDYTIPSTFDQASELNKVINILADEMHLELEIVPIEEFIPLPKGNDKRHKLIEQFGNLKVYVYDPYSIALSKLSRGFETDLQDILFLLRQNIINLDDLKHYVEAALPQAWDFNIDPTDLLLYFDEIQRLL
jgi:hypothetical protein